MQHHLPKIAIPNQTRGKYSATLCTWALALTCPWASAQTVYRCGNQYSANPSCNGATISSVEDDRNARQAQSQKMQTLQAQQEADALEKNRLKAEQQSARNVAMLPASNRDSLFSNTAATNNTSQLPTSHGKHRKLASPYFTAKDNTPKPPKPKTEKKGASPKAAP